MNKNFGIHKKRISYKNHMFGGNGNDVQIPAAPSTNVVQTNDANVPSTSVGQTNDATVPSTNVGQPMESPKTNDANVPSATVGQIIESSGNISSISVTSDIGNITHGPAKQSLQYMDPSHMTLYTIPVGTELYHGSTDISIFDPQRINIGKNTLVGFFSPNKSLASSYIKYCVHIDNGYIKGYIHKFIVSKDIDRLYILSYLDKELNWDEKNIETKFCQSTQFGKLNGVGFFIPDEIKYRLAENENSVKNNLYSSEFALCDPQQFLTYIGTFQCIGPRSLSEIYRFDK
jgi:hypothetical protein